MGKTGRKNKSYSPEFKISAIMDMRDNHMSYSETVRKYWGVESKAECSNYRHCLTRWERIFLEEGAEGLMKERRGKSCSASGTRKGRPPKLDKKVEEDLIAENQRLRIQSWQHKGLFISCYGSVQPRNCVIFDIFKP